MVTHDILKLMLVITLHNIQHRQGRHYWTITCQFHALENQEHCDINSTDDQRHHKQTWISWKLSLWHCCCTKSWTAASVDSAGNLSFTQRPFASRIWNQTTTDNLLSVPRHNLSFGSRTFRVAVHKICNSVPLHIRQSKTYSCFRRHPKTYYFHSAYPLAPYCALNLFWDFGAI